MEDVEVELIWGRSGAEIVERKWTYGRNTEVEESWSSGKVEAE